MNNCRICNKEPAAAHGICMSCLPHYFENDQNEVLAESAMLWGIVLNLTNYLKIEKAAIEKAAAEGRQPVEVFIDAIEGRKHGLDH